MEAHPRAPQGRARKEKGWERSTQAEGPHDGGRGSLRYRRCYRHLTPGSPLCRLTIMRLTAQSLKVLALLMSRANDELSGAEIGRATKLASGTLYPILLRLEEAGWAESRWEVENPHELGRPRRRFYQITGVGRRKARLAFRELALPLKEFAWC